jgi:hypothetical protein
MKKAALFAALMTVLALGAFAQVPASMVGKTFVYYYVETVDTDTGVRQVESNANSGWNRSVTFSEKSISIFHGTPDNYQFLREENGAYVFSGLIWGDNRNGATQYIYFSKDFRRINSRIFFNQPIINTIRWSNIIMVYDQTKPEPQPEQPMELY